MYVNDEHIEDTSGTFEQNNRSPIDVIFMMTMAQSLKFGN